MTLNYPNKIYAEPEKPTETHRDPQRPTETQRDPERSRETQRDPESLTHLKIFTEQFCNIFTWFNIIKSIFLFTRDAFMGGYGSDLFLSFFTLSFLLSNNNNRAIFYEPLNVSAQKMPEQRASFIPQNKEKFGSTIT